MNFRVRGFPKEEMLSRWFCLQLAQQNELMLFFRWSKQHEQQIICLHGSSTGSSRMLIIQANGSGKTVCCEGDWTLVFWPWYCTCSVITFGHSAIFCFLLSLPPTFLLYTILQVSQPSLLCTDHTWPRCPVNLSFIQGFPHTLHCEVAWIMNWKTLERECLGHLIPLQDEKGQWVSNRA